MSINDDTTRFPCRSPSSLLCSHFKRASPHLVYGSLHRDPLKRLQLNPKPRPPPYAAGAPRCAGVRRRSRGPCWPSSTPSSRAASAHASAHAPAGAPAAEIRLCTGIGPRPRRSSGMTRKASYLKLCGTISETPGELRNEESYENNLENTNECDKKPTSGPPVDCKLLFEANSSKGCEERHSLRSELNTEDAGHHHGVEFVPHSASSEKRLFQNIQHKPLDSGGSPFPTPLVLRDDMQTPGTAYASHRGTSISGKRVRTQKQFIYPVLRSIENRLRQTELTEDSSPLASSLKGRNLEADSIKDPTQISSILVVKSGLSETPSYSAPDADADASDEVKEALSPDELLDGKGLPKSNSDEKDAALSLSRWLKSSSTDAENQVNVKCPVGDQSYDDCTFVTEKPIFMASDLNLDTDNPTPRLPKAWDGNGIPNTTTIYKEVLICHSI
ncbi:protein JASON-like isoform X3 [Miscanthus floridulus]|uniref:protein JASON-like isoform X3 n=1 Tax=Miscanthus floridulus TaxID=154761 RepID=UPI0034586A64